MLSSVLNRILRDSQTAEEILQDIFFQLWYSPDRDSTPSRGSLPGMADGDCAQSRDFAIAAAQSGRGRASCVETTVVSTFNLESAASQQQLLGRVKGALENLPVEQRAAVELAYFEGLTHSEIAERTGDPLGTVKTRLRSAVETLKRDPAFGGGNDNERSSHSGQEDFDLYALGALEGDEELAIESHVAACA